MSQADTISGTLEDYLEAILELIRVKDTARVRDIAKALSVHKSTVTATLKSLAEKGLVNYVPYEIATLTPKGRKIAEEVTQTHRIISRFLTDVFLIEKSVAEENACRMEHVIDKEVLDRWVLFAQFVKKCPRAGEDWLERFAYFVQHGGKIKPDESSTKEFLQEFRKKLKEQSQKCENKQATTTLEKLKPGQKGRIRREGTRHTPSNRRNMRK